MRFLSVMFMPVLAVIAGPVALAMGAEPDVGAPVLVVAPPWGPPPESIVHAAGGAVMSPEQNTISTLAVSEDADFLEKLRQSGAIILLDGRRLAAICGV